MLNLTLRSFVPLPTARMLSPFLSSKEECIVRSVIMTFVRTVDFHGIRGIIVLQPKMRSMLIGQEANKSANVPSAKLDVKEMEDAII